MIGPPAFATRDLRVDSPLHQNAATSRLIPELAPLLTPEVLAPLPPSLALPSGPQPHANWLAERIAESTVQTVRARGTGTLVGLLITHGWAAGIEPPSVHLGYLFARASWGKGYATQLVQGLVQALSSSVPCTLIGGVDRDNPASARVLQKAGFDLDPHKSAQDTLIYVQAVGG